MEYLVDPPWPWSISPAEHLVRLTGWSMWLSLGRFGIGLLTGLLAYLTFPRPGKARMFAVIGMTLLGSYLARQPLPWWVGCLVAFFTIASYLDSSQPGRSVGRVSILLLLRLTAIALTLVTIFRPALLFPSDEQPEQIVLLAKDFSRSMTVKDEFNNQTRWEAMQATLQRCQKVMQQLHDERRVKIIPVGFADRVVDDVTNLEPDGPRSDYGGMLANLWERYGREPNLRGLIIIGDGADNGQRYSAAIEARRFGAARCPIYCFVTGRPIELDRGRDLLVKGISVEPSPAYIKGRMVIRVVVDAVGFENATVMPELRLDGDLVTPEKISVNGESESPPRLTQIVGNELTLEITAPEKPGEYKVAVTIPPLPGETSITNNEASTFATVSKEGVSVLLVAPLDEETKYLRRALATDPRIRLHEMIRQTDAGEPIDDAAALNFDRQAYDVVILRNVSAQRLAGGNATLLQSIRDRVVKNGMGLLMMGGFDSFGGSIETNSVGNWAGTPVAELLPVEVDRVSGHVDSRRDGVPIGLYPTAAGESHYLLRLDQGKKTWERLHDVPNRGVNLLGMNRLGAVKPTALLLATAQPNRPDLPILVAHSVGKGRVLAFAGDTTYLWRLYGLPDTTEGLQIHQRFWKQTVLWLAHQENAEGNIWAKLDFRRLPSGSRQGFTVGARGKSGLSLPKGKYEARIVAPNGTVYNVPVRPEGDSDRGEFWQTIQPGEYRLEVKGQAEDPEGQLVTGQAEGRFIVYEDDREMLQTAADIDLLSKLSAEAGGRATAYRIDELPTFLEQLRNTTVLDNPTLWKRYPDWRSPRLGLFLPFWLVLLALVLTAEWALRRLWGMA